MGNQINVMMMAMVMVFQGPQVSPSLPASYRLYYGSNCYYSSQILGEWERFAEQEQTTSWDCARMVCRYPTPTLFVFHQDHLEDIHVGSASIILFLNQYPTSMKINVKMKS